MNGIILAAGRGSRLGRLTADRPKCLVPLAGRPLIHWQRAALAGAGVERLSVVAGYRREMLAGGRWHVMVAPRWEHSNMVTSLCAASPWLRAGPCLVSYGDIVFSAATAARLAAAPGELAIAYDPGWRELWSRRFTDPLDDAETFRLAADGTLAEIGGRASTLDEIEGQYMGLLRFTPKSWRAVEASLARLDAGERDHLDMTSLLQRLIDEGHPIEAVPCVGRWAEVDQEQDLCVCERLVASGELRPADGEAS